ncbi:MAG: hypothetical protein WKG01_35795 [Kofleriaceae bacterium]
MGFRNGEMHAFAGLGAVLISVALVVPSMVFESCNERAEAGPVLEDMESIEASLAYKKPNAPKQPQKQTREAVKNDPLGVSRDETKEVQKVCCTTKADCKDAALPFQTACGDGKVCRDFQCVKEQLAKTNDPEPNAKVPDRTKGLDDPVGPTDTSNAGAFDGSEFGIGDVTKGDPYFQRLVADLAWEAPELARGTSEPIGCIHITADGKIAETKFKERGDDDLATLSESALKGLQRKRNDKPEEVPTHLLGKLTTRWVCFKFSIRPPD